MTTTTVTKETTALPEFILPHVETLEEYEGRNSGVQSPRPEQINPLPSSDPFHSRSFGQGSQQQGSSLRIHRGRSPVTPTPSAGHSRRQTRTPARSAPKPSEGSSDENNEENQGGNDPPNPPDPPGPHNSPPTPRRTIKIKPNPPPPGATNKERGNRPDPFTKKSQRETFQMQLILFFSQNDHLYPTEADKVLFALSLCTGEAQAQFAKLIILGEAKSGKGWGTFHEFLSKMDQTFGDPNEERNEFLQWRD
jgi:hypothetical protein